MSEIEKKYFSAAWGKDLSRAFYNLSKSRMVHDYTEKDVEAARAKRKLEIEKEDETNPV